MILNSNIAWWQFLLQAGSPTIVFETLGGEELIGAEVLDLLSRHVRS